MKNKVVIITGATSGIGKSCALQYGNKGAKIVITGRTLQTLEATSKELKKNNIEHLALLSDASKEEDNKKMVEQTIKKYKKIDVLIANAGISMRAMFQELDLNVFKQVMDINFYGAIYATKYALPYILQSKGSIIAISSINGHRATPARTAYSASKYAMEGFFEALRSELLKKEIHILVVSPGFTTSNIRKKSLTFNGTMQKESPRNEDKMMSSETVAKKLYNAHMKRKRDLVLTTQGKLAIWLNKFFPAMMDKIVFRYFSKEANSPVV